MTTADPIKICYRCRMSTLYIPTCIGISYNFLYCIEIFSVWYGNAENTVKRALFDEVRGSFGEAGDIGRGEEGFVPGGATVFSAVRAAAVALAP
ncbi:MAG: hypothetical protein Q4C53_09465 [Clostridia bacterium]|nr:hypothetical protein [Clostridia bacterium]